LKKILMNSPIEKLPEEVKELPKDAREEFMNLLNQNNGAISFDQVNDFADRYDLHYPPGQSLIDIIYLKRDGDLLEIDHKAREIRLLQQSPTQQSPVTSESA
jgi:hypothetical protein